MPLRFLLDCLLPLNDTPRDFTAIAVSDATYLTAPPFLYADTYEFGGRGIARDSAGTCMASGSDSALGPFSPHDPSMVA